ncbi:MAG: AsmA-like C-terminal region-containing protein [Paracoccaceae bacterium]|nr:AsmA-like C-terminal region-containing protein [Paracoccaceae bacterium]
MTDATETTDTPKSRRRRKGGLVVLGVFAALMLLICASAFVVTGRPIDAPPWLRERIEARIDAMAPGLNVEFGRMSLLVERSGLARVILWDVMINNDLGEEVAQLSDIEAGLSPAGLLRGQVVLKEAQVSGAFVTLQRDRDGRLGLALGNAFAQQTDTPDLAAIIGEVDAAFSDPRLSQLRVIEADALTIRYEDARARRGWTADGGRLRVSRQGGELRLAGDLALLGGGDQVATIELNAQSPIGATDLEFGVVLNGLSSGDIATQSPALAWLDALDAPISGALRSRVLGDGSLGPLNATLQIGAGVLRPNRATKPLPFDAARTYFTYDPARAVLQFDEISITSPLGQATADGFAALEGVDAGWPRALVGQFDVSGMQIAEGELLDRAVDIAGAEMAFKLELDPFRLTLGGMRLTDPDLPGRITGQLDALPDGWSLSLDAELARTTPAQVLSFWPEDFKPKARSWLVEHIVAGDLSNVHFALRAIPDAEPVTYLDLQFDAAEVFYNLRLPPVEDASGHLSLYDNRLGLKVDGGNVDPGQGGRIDIAGSTFTITNAGKPDIRGELDLVASGSVTAALAYIDSELWQVLAKTGRDPGLATGRAEVAGRLELPLRKGVRLADMTLALNGRLRGVSSDTIVAGRALRGEELALTVTETEVAIEGPVTLSGVAAQGVWRQPLQGGGAGSVVAEVVLTDNNLRRFGVRLPDGMISGQGTGQLEIDLAQGEAPQFTLQSDLAGIGLRIDPLGWRLERGATGRFTVEGVLGQPLQVGQMTLRGAGLEAAGRLSLREGGGFESLSFSKLTYGRWMDVTGRLVGRGAGNAPRIEIASGVVDLRDAPFATGGGGEGGGGNTGGTPMSVTLSSLQVTDSIRLRNFVGDFDTAGGFNGRFRGNLGNKAPVEGRITPRNGRSAIRVTGEDAGEILKAAGLLKTVQNGTFRLDLTPVRGTAGSFDGTLEIREARLRNAPGIAALLDAISIVGLLDQLNGPGIFFGEVEAEFRLTPSQVILKRSSAVGPSMGISMDGYYDLSNGTMDMQGVLSPVYMLNVIGRLFSRKGEGLIGFNFNLRGPASEPRVLVNPLSVFTPGMFRDIFRRPPPRVSQ